MAKAQVSLEALVSVSAFLALIIILSSFFVFQSIRLNAQMEKNEAHSLAIQTSLISDFFAIDGKGAVLPERVFTSKSAGADPHTLIVKFRNSTSESTVIAGVSATGASAASPVPLLKGDSNYD